jgi:microcystin-dependent protein
MASVALGKGALWMQNVDYPAAWDRTLIDALWATEGVIDGFAVTPTTGLGLSISGGRAVVSGDDTVANTGKYLVDQDGAVTLTVAAVGTTRTEYVWLSINDTAVAGGRAGNNVTIETSTTAPPASALLLATLSLTAGTSTITAGMIADNRVYTDLVPAGSIATADLANLAVTGAKIADSTITSAKIVDGTIVAGDIADGAITSAKILDGTIATADLADGAVTLTKLSAAVQSLLDAADPADAIIAIGGSTAPTGWALCDGAAYSRTTYAATYARIGTTYGVGDGSTTFNVPDLRNRFVAGKGPATWSDTINEKAGSKDAVAVAHTHGHPDHGHAHTITASSTQGQHAHTEGAETGTSGWLFSGAYDGVHYDTFVGSNLSGSRSTYAYVQPSTGLASAGAITTTISGGVTNGNAGTTNSQSPTASGTDANLPPYITLNYAIRLR